MYLTHLSLTNYRAFTRLDMDMPRRILLLVGDNAQGKTSLLEAVYYLATLTSFHAQHDRQLINFFAQNDALAVARLVADYERNGQAHRMEVRVIQEGGRNGSGTRVRKEILVDGLRCSAQNALGNFTAVIFLPQMMRILEGGPDERRRYLNLALAQVVPGYAQALSEYTQALTQRNALLKQLAERGGDADQLLYWDELLTRRGAFIIRARIAAVEDLETEAAIIHNRISNNQEMLRMVYQPSFDPLTNPPGQYSLPVHLPAARTTISEEEIRAGFAKRLAAQRGEEIARGVTTTGPHRDELRVLANGIDLGDFGSRGQVRTALLSMKLAELNWMKRKSGEWPVLLLDEILAELDIQRRADLLAYLGSCEQAVLSTTDLNLFKSEFVQQHTVWQVKAGQIDPL